MTVIADLDVDPIFARYNYGKRIHVSSSCFLFEIKMNQDLIECLGVTAAAGHSRDTHVSMFSESPSVHCVTEFPCDRG